MGKGYNSEFNNQWSREMVRVDLNFTSNSGGKKVFDWNFSVPGKRDWIVVEVRAMQREGDVWFEAANKYLPGGASSTDINELKREVTERLNEQMNLLTDVDWEDWYEVVVTGDNSDFDDNKRFSALGANLKIQVNQLKRGIHPGTGRVLTVNGNGAVMDFPSPRRLGDEETTSLSGFRTGDMSEKSYIPATAENRRAIDHILARMAELRHSIADLLSQDNIEDSLEKDVLKALPRP